MAVTGKTLVFQLPILLYHSTFFLPFLLPSLSFLPLFFSPTSPVPLFPPLPPPHQEGDQETATKMQDLALAEGALPRHLHTALFTSSLDNRLLTHRSGYLCPPLYTTVHTHCALHARLCVSSAYLYIVVYPCSFLYILVYYSTLLFIQCIHN